jgi:single-stranded-DNA-specific exonuclease
MAELERLEPHGVENREPLFFTRAARVTRVRRVGQGHLRLDLEADGRSVSAIGFGQAEEEPGSRIAEGDRIDALHTPYTNVWNGMSVTELRIRDLRLAT